MNNRAGAYVEALSGIAAYKAYKPSNLPPQPPINIDDEMISLLIRSHEGLGSLNMLAEVVPNKDLFIGAYVRKEALLSSQIEGTQATMEDILSADVMEAVNLEVVDVVNYVNALNFALKAMETLPICNRLLCDVHKVLLSGVRGQEKNPGEFRKSQNWIGASNSSINNARYVPPTVENMREGMNELEKFINENDDINVLIKVALTHYQFETIHPFLDGNGRVGRMLITLMLLQNGILKAPIFYMSLFLKSNRAEYYDRLSEVRAKGNFEQWIKFFLRGVIETCDDSIDTIKKLTAILDADRQKTENETASVKAIYNYIKAHPIVDIGGVEKALNFSFATVARGIDKLTRLGIVKETTMKARKRIFQYEEYINILKIGT